MRNRHGLFRRAWLPGALLVGLVLVLCAPTIAAAGVMKLPQMTPLFPSAFAAADPVAIPVVGATRYLTAVEASKHFASAATVVVASGETFPDALGGAALAGAADGPLLLTPAAAVPAEVLAEIDRLGATKVYVLGGTGAVSASAYAQLDAAVDTVVRLGGATRYQTAQLVADEAISLLGASYAGDAFMATGANFPDALAASPIMCAEGIPLVLVNAAGGYTLPASATDIVILGGPGVVPATVQTSLGTKFETRLAGANRYSTAVEVANYGVILGMSWNNVGVATGENFPDALCAGPLVGSMNAVLLLTTTQNISSDALIALGDHKIEIAEYYLFGGTGALSDTCRNEIAAILADAVPPGASHALPDLSCAAAGCHDSDLASIHTAVGCAMCHGAGVEPSSDCIACHGNMVHDTTAAHVEIVSAPAAPAEGCTQAMCHGAGGVMTFHQDGCETCHESSDVAVRDAVTNGNATCESCHEFDIVHTGGEAAHALTGGCYSATCHVSDAAELHTTDFRGTGANPPGCICHVLETATNDCATCHGDVSSKHNASAAHAGVEAGIGGEVSGGCVTCHGDDLMNVTAGEHVGCSCHRYNIVRGATECQSCHEDPTDPDAEHPYHVGVHDAAESAIEHNSAGCVSCHGSDLMAVLPEGNAATGVSEHNGCTCHQYGEVAGQTACEDCHVDPMDPGAQYPYHVGAHAELEADIGGDTSNACTACHGTYVLAVGTVSMHVADAHAGCSCHALDEATPDKTECVDCHRDEYAPHAFADGVNHTGGGWVAASGHSTTALGKRGVYENFGFLPITDTLGNSIDTTSWPWPTVDVFWSGFEADRVPFSMPGLNKNSVITCEDCHTGLINYEVAGPHGSNVVANAGIDPNFPGKFEEAYLWAGPLPSGGTTVSSGIARYIPGGANDLEKEEIANWALQVWTSATTTIPGPATVVSGNDVICAKCHNLQTDNTGILGWSNYGHEHHDTAPVNYLGLFQRASDGTTYTASAAEETSDTVLKARSVGREGAGACRNCHVAIPHGWMRPRLIVYSTDPAPFNIGPAIYEGEDTSFPLPEDSVEIGSGQMNGLSSVIGPQPYAGASAGANRWSGSQCNACGHHVDTDLSGGAWK